MREIKFRAWDDINEVMVIPKIIDNPFNWMNSTYDQLMQYTGLKDKNGVEIYDGDLLHNGDHEYSIARIIWSDRYNGWCLDDDYETIHGDDLTDAMRDYMVIGNIYENPELLEDKD